MIYLENDFYSNFNSMVEASDEVSTKSMFIDQISNLIAFKKNELVSLFGKIGIKVSSNPTNKELSNIIANNIKSNKKLQIGLAYLIAENNNILQQEMKKSRPSDDGSGFLGESDSEKKKAPTGTPPKKRIDWNKTADAVTAIADSMSVMSDTIVGAKTGQFADDLNGQANVKSPEEIAKEEEERKIADAKKKKRRKNMIIGVVVVALAITAIVAYKKGWFKKGDVNPN